MTAEVMDQPPVDPLSEAGSEAGSLQTFLLAILERHDGLCLDNEPERLQLAIALATAFISAVRDDTVNASVIAGDPERPDDNPAPN